MKRNMDSTIATLLMNWYRSQFRDLPWRNTKEPYRIWISEIMAQQTKIATLIPYYERFLEKFPTIEILAAADRDEVLTLWTGLGYYQRAHNIHKAAKLVVKEYDGRFPSTLKELKSLPGIGDYTSGAILSICYGEEAPAIDGNVKRVFSRVRDNRNIVNSKEMLEEAKIFVKDIMPYAEPSILTQALMELGALVCFPKSPKCSECPLHQICEANKKGIQESLPAKAKKQRKRIEEMTLLIIENENNEILLSKREDALLEGMYEYFLIKEKISPLHIEEAIQKHLHELGLEYTACDDMEPSQHIFTHLIWKMDGYHCYVKEYKPISNSSKYQFYSKKELEEMPIPVAFSSFTKQILK